MTYACHHATPQLNRSRPLGYACADLQACVEREPASRTYTLDRQYTVRMTMQAESAILQHAWRMATSATCETGAKNVTIASTTPVSTRRDVWNDTEDATDVATLESLVRSIWRYRTLVVVVTLLAVAVTYGASLLAPEVFRSELRIFLTDPRYTSFNSDSARARIDPEVYTVQQVRRLTADPVLRLASARLDGRWSIQDLKASVAAEPEEEALIIRVRADAGRPDDAARMATATANALRQFNEETATVRLDAALAELRTSQQQLRDKITANKKELDENPTDSLLRARAATLNEQLLALDTTARGLAVDAASFGSGVDFIEAAETPTTPIQPNPKRNAALGGAVGFAAAVAIADALSRRRRRVLSRTDPERILSAPLLGEIPTLAVNDLGSSASVSDAAGEAFRVIMASLDFALAQPEGAVVALTSVKPGPENAVSAAQLAFAAAHDGKRVVVVDCDLRARSLTRVFDAVLLAGITDLASGAEEYGVVLSEARSQLGDEITVVPAGRGDISTAGLLRSERFEATVRRLSAEHDLVLLDLPPVMRAEASIVAERADGLVLIVNRGTAFTDIAGVAERLTFVPVPLVGYIYNRSPRIPHRLRTVRRRTDA